MEINNKQKSLEHIHSRRQYNSGRLSQKVESTSKIKRAHCSLKEIKTAYSQNDSRQNKLGLKHQSRVIQSRLLGQIRRNPLNPLPRTLKFLDKIIPHRILQAR